jgi:CBS domain-containing protein
MAADRYEPRPDSNPARAGRRNSDGLVGFPLRDRRSGRLVVLLGRRDLMRAWPAHGKAAPIRRAMRPGIIRIGPDASLAEARRRLRADRSRPLVVVGGEDQVVGTLTEADLWEASHSWRRRHRG